MPDNKKKCSSCKKVKPLSEFTKNKRQDDGLAVQCKGCINLRNRTVWREKNRVRMMGRNFGISLEDYDKMWDAQGGLCAICGMPETAKMRGVIKYLAVDHDHATGQIRGLLCQCCNAGLGYFEDNQANLLKAIQYLMEGS